MKKSSPILVLLFAVFIALQINAQNVRLSATSVKFRSDTSSYGLLDQLDVLVQNTGSQPFQGKFYVNYTVSTPGSGSTVVMVLDSSSTLSSFQPKDTIRFTHKDFVIKQNSFNMGLNIVVVWPSSTGITLAAGDSATTSVFVKSPTGITQLEIPENGIVLYPNPAFSRLYIMSVDPKMGIENVRIYNTIGSLVKTAKCNNNLIDISSLERGLYLLEIETSTNRSIVKRFVRE